ncbi:carboxypeptidase-like regulatory domain-containing protein [Mucilaginibacter myungsuensis]|uniref:Carboxypeptidase regulatory-like domain-containing protein n=1 Tax=Mucilaginibacter myungsuensis TaxID=649104 RepID=A0A929PXR5_9SPHI|nr:carboxypeptidase-like regulatory domain-containing protein [Mucilaginibacter myungsuensis]MBE9663441.1 carboxypeptidase regulatory-like domain-containing protein [Mucilaginibacter myungsuensis]MDN3600179.1 carboxypeptidase-like regulatory domain-containing protein [Mucilaginibacter myungsuensis]
MTLPDLKTPLLSILLFLLPLLASAQTKFTISGKVTGEKGEPMRAATVFINGTTRIMPTDNNGTFAFPSLAPGSYQVSVQMLGYHAATATVELIQRSADISISLKIKPTALREVVIGNKANLSEYYSLFKRELLGESDNGRSCKLLNEEVVNLTTGRQYLTADADDFLIVMNNRLGYKIRYQLKSFRHTLGSNYSTIAGDAVFEEMDGTDKQKKQWAKNRADTYKGSLRRFLRAVYKGNVLQEGFTVHARFDEPKNSAPGYLYIDHRPANFDTLTKVVDNAFKTLHFKMMYANYDPKKAASFKNQGEPFKLRRIVRAVTSTLLSMDERPVKIDRAGNCIDCNISQNGKWGLMRLGDQLPSDYKPEGTN